MTWDVPTWWQFTILALAAYRLTRLVGWDDLPPIYRARAWLIGEHWVPLEPGDDSPEDWFDRPPSLPGKQPGSEVEGVRPAYDRPLLAHFVHCPFCVGFWIAVAVYLGWLGGGDTTLLAMTPFALAAVVGLVARNLDP